MPKISANSKKTLATRPLNLKGVFIFKLLAAILVAVVVIFAFQYFQPKKTSWNTFKSAKEIGVSFEYPSSWQKVSSGESNIPILLPKNEDSIGVTIYCYSESRNKTIAWLVAHEDLVSSQRMDVKGFDAIKIHSTGRGGGERLELLIEGVECSGKRQMLRLTMFSNQNISPKYKSDFDHIISTLNFID